MLTLGIETSCDETSIALLDNEKIICNTIYSQVEHAHYGGVVPEIASRAHVEKIEPLARQVFAAASITPKDIDLIAVTDSPGLAGALLVGISFALGLHVGYGTPITGVNHLEGHISSVFLAHPAMEYPFLALVVSGGHTAIYRVDSFGVYTILGQTVDDAAGEAFDKVGKLLGLPYPAGRAIEQEAAKVSQDSKLTFPVAKVSSGTYNFSFSGLKTAVKYYCKGKDEMALLEQRPEICRAFQKAVVDSLVHNLAAASKQTGIKRVAMAGGVACNGKLREVLKNTFGDNVFFPSPSLCTDNAAMIALAGYKRFQLSLTRFPHLDPAQGIG